MKLVRLLAHLAISSEVGPEMGKSPHVEAMLRLLENVSIQETEELLLNTVSLVTNLTYYASSSSVLSSPMAAFTSGGPAKKMLERPRTKIT